MNKISLKAIVPHLISISVFILLAYVYCLPIVQGKQLVAHDTVSWRCMAQETINYNENHSDVTLWTNSMFGGMPTYQISTDQPNNYLQYVERVINSFPRPVSNFVLYLLCFYILMLMLGSRPWLALLGAVAFTFASYNVIIISAGHNSKAITIAYMAPLIGAVFLAYRKKIVAGALLTALFLSLAIRANHIQILYYTLIVLLIFVIVEFIFSIKEKTLKRFFKTSALMVAACAVAIGMNATSLLTTNEYSQHTMRGKSNGLTADTQSSQEGLNKDYITQWSYGIDETLTLLIPNFKGGASSGHLSEDSNTGKELKAMRVPNVKKMLSDTPLPLYWGTQPFTSGPVYIGAIVILLFVLGFFVVERRTKWWLVPMIILTLMLSWGKNFPLLTNIFIDYVPLYNKFRAVAMMLVATGFGITLMALLAAKEIFSGKLPKEKLIKYLYISTAIVGGISLIFALVPSLAGSFVSPQDGQFQGDFSFLRNTLPLDRESLLRADAFRSLVFVLLAAATIWIFAKGKIKENVAIVVLALLVLVDLFPVAQRYLNEDNFENRRKAQTVEPSQADKLILKDQTDYRVLDISVNSFNDATPSYFHKNIGGYHAAKLRRYQELINMQIDGEMKILISGLQSAKSANDMSATLQSLGVLNMLNMKYVIYNKNAAPIVNPFANGNAWLVQNIEVVNSANEEMKRVGEIDTKTTLVVDKSMANILPKEIEKDSTATISLKSYEPNHLVYTFSSAKDQVAIFSEIYYKQGWHATINGAEVPYTRANYLLRAMPLKAGNYDIEFAFTPSSYYAGNTIAMISSIIFIVLIVGFVVVSLRKKDSEEEVKVQ